ncbi:MAG: hypothetical protein WBM98_10460 [Maribacter sp.]|uniref:VOC family protein n=1 Tax=Maribacter sp. TaxID=1897614 RepID=UPI003C7789AA
MAKIDPIIAVKDIEASSKWYQSIFDCRSMHVGKEFDILVSENDEVLLCLHKWGEHGHQTMKDSTINPGNGLILYFRTENMNAIRQNVEKIGGVVEEDIHLNPNSRKKEFSLCDLTGIGSLRSPDPALPRSKSKTLQPERLWFLVFPHIPNKLGCFPKQKTHQFGGFCFLW